MRATCIELSALAILGLAFTACEKGGDDPIVGDWNVIEFEPPYRLPGADSYGYPDGYSLHIDDDLSGTFEETYEFFGWEPSVSRIEVDASDAPKYRIELKEQGKTLACTLSGDRLDCGKYLFERD